MVDLSQGEIWWAETEEEGRRPVLVVTRSEATLVLRKVIVAPITTTIRQIPTTIPLGRDEGLGTESVAMFDNLLPMPRSLLTERVGSLANPRQAICRALSALADC